MKITEPARSLSDHARRLPAHARHLPEHARHLPARARRLPARLIAAYETRHANRVGVLEAITALAGDEPWPGYDDQNITEITATLADHDAASVREVGAYERAHKDRVGVRAAVEHRSETIRAA